jgi:hypothetical protein
MDFASAVGSGLNEVAYLTYDAQIDTYDRYVKEGRLDVVRWLHEHAHDIDGDKLSYDLYFFTLDEDDDAPTAYYLELALNHQHFELANYLADITQPDEEDISMLEHSLSFLRKVNTKAPAIANWFIKQRHRANVRYTEY